MDDTWEITEEELAALNEESEARRKRTEMLMERICRSRREADVLLDESLAFLGKADSRLQ